MKATLVAPYPRTANAHDEEGLGGVASYTKRLAESLTPGGDVEVLSPATGAEGHREDGVIKIHDVLQASPRFFAAVAELGKDATVGVVHVQFEQHLYGGPSQNLRLALALNRLRRSKQVVATLHQVPDLRTVDKKFMAENGFWPPIPSIARTWLRVQYNALRRGCDRVIVHEPVMADRLVEQYGFDSSEIEVIPHGIDVRTPTHTQAEAKRELGLTGKTVALYFGYVTGYKGIDLLADALEDVPAADREELRVVIAGKVPDRKLENARFRARTDALEAQIAALGDWVQRKGFLSESEIALHLAAADVVIFPYRQVFAASGPLALAVGHGRPFLASEAFTGFIACKPAMFPLTREGVVEKLMRFRADPKFREQLAAAVSKMRDDASWPRVGVRTRAAYVKCVEGNT